ncbi:MAG: YggS family pyridoxal phosphate-dependent enzyme, partial [Verrucomicrobiota bacterium]|nr:YggS family pyridoxal phosphate-dependent enzyme [Verrucomicrobiota bacterium]MEC7236042.1 YggS family pyridoxal phosphate-dependent enzyme [Verrucomicrobiota bacterium]
MINYPKFKENLSVVRARVARACELSGRLESSVSLLPVTKNNPVEAIDYAVRGGLKAVGENRVQEASDKRDSCTNEIRWELIGHLQSNKAQDAVAIFDRIQSVDSLKLLRRLDRFAGEQGKKLAILLQCNTGKDPNKHGFAEEEVPSAMEVALELSNLQVDGLMTIAPLDDNPKVASAAFKSL